MIDADFLRAFINGGDQKFYVCGPPPMVEALLTQLKSLGAGKSAIIVEI
jgi:NAD(P)H-flavin reductase